MRLLNTFILFISFFSSWSQVAESLIQSKKIIIKEQMLLDSVSLNPLFFKVLDLENKPLQDSLYEIDFTNAILRFKSTKTNLDSIRVQYLKYPDFMTRTYKQLDSNIIVNSTDLTNTLYQLSKPSEQQTAVPFDGLTTSGSLSRGVTIGNKQNSVLNSELDLQISGKLNEKVTLRASIQDANIPLQQTGYSQRLDEFDQVFIEAFTDHWSIRAGDIDLESSSSYFGQFSKRVQGLLVRSSFKNTKNESNAFVSGALVRGQFTRSQFTALEGNQGPYKLKGPNNELFVLIVSGSETVYVNGVELVRGATNDYIIDYNAGEIIFNPTYPINSEMRITVDYQYSERNYTRFVGYAGGQLKSEKLFFGLSFYNENDLKNQPLQQNLSSDQAAVLSQAGDDRSLMTAPSASLQDFSENRILYKKEFVNGQEIFVFSNNPEDELYHVNFLMVGDLQGDYVLASSSSISNIYEYIAPISGQSQGNYAPIIQLVAPIKLQLAVLNGRYAPSKKTNIEFETAASRNDLNLFSSLSDSDNDGLAARYKLTHKLWSSSDNWNIALTSGLDYIQKNFRNLERLYNPEFNRDWNLVTPSANGIVSDLGTQFFATNAITLSKTNLGQINYAFQHLNFSENFNGNRHIFSTDLNSEKLDFQTHSSLLKTNSERASSNFIRSQSQIRYRIGKFWPGLKFSTEKNEIISKLDNQLDSLSQRFSSYEGFLGIGDSTKVFVKFGYIHRVNDSVQGASMQRVNQSDTYYLKSKLIASDRSDLSLFVNYRLFDLKTQSPSLQKSLNSRIFYNQAFAKNLVQWQTVYETNSGQLPQQDFTYVEVEPGQGSFVWFDYNANGVQELEEFEVAQFQDQATYIRVLLPNQVFIRTHQNRLSQSLTFDPIQWASSKKKDQKFWSHFYNLTSYLIDRKDQNDFQTINLNPFKSEDGQQLGLQSNFRNQLFYNRGKQFYTMAYSYFDSELKNVLSFGSISQKGSGHQFNFTHKVQSQWLLNFQVNLETNRTISENFSSKNYHLEQLLINPKLSYLLDNNKRFDLFYQFEKKDNIIQNGEVLEQHKLGISAVLNQNHKAAITAEFNYFSNNFKGNANSPVAYQMMQGLQDGTNFTWSIIAQKKLTKFLDLNLNYFGRKTETSKTIHTGTVQLKAYF